MPDRERSFRDEESRVRSKLANERNLGAWIRTGLTLVAVGLAIARFFPDSGGGRQILFVLLGAGFVLGGIFIQVFAYVEYRVGQRAIKREDYHAPKRWYLVIVLGLVFLSLGLLALIAWEALA